MTKQAGKGKVKVKDRHVHLRIAYLHQAAQLLHRVSAATAGCKESENVRIDHKDIEGSVESSHKMVCGPSDRLVSHIPAIARKATLKIAPSLRRTICKGCKSLLIPGDTSISKIENLSKDQKKSWADVMVVRCLKCGFEKRYPVRARRQAKKKDRTQAVKEEDVQTAPPVP